MPSGNFTDPYPTGHIVYEPYRPLFYGKVLRTREAIISPTFTTVEYLIRWKDGTESWVRYYHLKSLEDLVADHAKKLKGHKKRLAEAKNL
jgi:hypothetical protein